VYSREKAALTIFEDQSASLQKSLDKLTVEKASSDVRITELVEEFDANKIYADKLAVENSSKLEVALSSLSESQQALGQAIQVSFFVFITYALLDEFMCFTLDM
jgi:hypothetical protein